MNIKIFLLFFILRDYTMHGFVIVLQGTTSSGKSSLSVALQKKLHKKNIATVSIDDFLWQATIQKAQDLGLLHENMPLDEKQKIVMTHAEIVFKDFIATHWFEPLKKAHEYVYQLMQEGNIVIFDMVFNPQHPEVYQHFCNLFEKHQYSMIITYCSPVKLLEHVISRNNIAGYEQKRNPIFTLQQYCELYKSATNEDVVIDYLPWQDIVCTMNALHTYVSGDSKKLHNLDDTIKQLTERYQSTFFYPQEQHGQITSKLPFDFFVDTGQNDPDTCADYIIAHLKKNPENSILLP